jgi:hypothetical protein
VVAAKRARQPTWYPWALVVLFAAASVAFNILHALDRYLTAARWVRPLVFAMPPVALVLATHLLLQQGAWKRQHPNAKPDRTDAAAAAAPRPHRGGTVAHSATGTAEEAATRQHARRLYAQAEAAGRQLTGAQLGRAIGRSDRYGRLLLREFRVATSAGDNGEPPQ